MNATHDTHMIMKDVHMNLSQLQAFAALVDTGSFTEAANTINLTQSAVSHALAALESELGVTLVARNRKGVAALTTVGEKIMPHVRALLCQAEAIEQEAKVAHGLAVGKLRLGNTFCLCPGLLASVLTSFQRQYPEVDVVLFEGTLEEVEEWIEHSIVDIGFVPLPATGMDSTLITLDELCVAVPTGHHLNTQPAVASWDLRAEKFIMPRSDECVFRLMDLAGVDVTEFRPAIRYQASDSATILAMVREGLGITLLPRMMLPTKVEGIAVLPLDPPQQLEIRLAIRARESASPAARLFVQTALDWAQTQASLLDSPPVRVKSEPELTAPAAGFVQSPINRPYVGT